jgi:hypothetical protein
MKKFCSGDGGLQRRHARAERRDVALLKHLALTFSFCFLLTGCQPKPTIVDFTENAVLDKVGGIDVVNPASKTAGCGTDPFEFSYTNVNAKFGILQVTNRGVCKVTVNVFQTGGGQKTDIVPNYDVASGRGDITAFPMPLNPTIKVSFTCGKTEAAGQCEYSYKFSTGLENLTPMNASLPAALIEDVMPPPQPTGNQCFTPEGEESVVRVISNKTNNAVMKVEFTAQSKCGCDPFRVFADRPPPRPGRSKQADAKPNRAEAGFVVLAKGQTTSLKVRCGTGSLATELCKGDVKDIRISLTTTK